MIRQLVSENRQEVSGLADRHDAALNVVEWVAERIDTYGALVDAAGDFSSEGLARFAAAKARMQDVLS